MTTGVLVSGGVDSSVALALMVQAGMRPTAFYLKVWLEDELGFLGDCPWQEDLHYARAVCERLGVPLEVVPLQRAYRERIVEMCLAELRSGRTPTPDVFCNREIKLGAFLEAVGSEITTVATGHYARRTRAPSGAPLLELARDRTKDQTYFLSRLDVGQLDRTLFPLGDLTKSEVRRLADQLSLATASRPDSQGICFLGRIRWRDFIQAHLGVRTGPILDESGREIGQHRGHWFLTLGQRHGLGLGGGPWFVVAKDPEANSITVRHASSSVEDPRKVPVEAAHWIADPPQPGEGVTVKVRHGPALADATWHGSHVVLGQGDRGTAPGQLVVVYRGEVCLGSALIASR